MSVNVIARVRHLTDLAAIQLICRQLEEEGLIKTQTKTKENDKMIEYIITVDGNSCMETIPKHRKRKYANISNSCLIIKSRELQYQQDVEIVFSILDKQESKTACLYRIVNEMNKSIVEVNTILYGLLASGRLLKIGPLYNIPTSDIHETY